MGTANSGLVPTATALRERGGGRALPVPAGWMLLALVAAMVGCGGGAEPPATATSPATAAAVGAAAQDVLEVRRSALAADSAVAASGSVTLFAKGAYGSGVQNWSWNLCNTNLTTRLGRQTVLYFNECQGGDWSSGGYLHLDAAAVDAATLSFDVYLGTQPAVTAQQIYLSFGDGTQGMMLSSLLPERTKVNNIMQPAHDMGACARRRQGLICSNRSGQQ